MIPTDFVVVAIVYFFIFFTSISIINFFFNFLTGEDVGQWFPRCEQVMLLSVAHVDSRNKYSTVLLLDYSPVDVEI